MWIILGEVFNGLKNTVQPALLCIEHRIATGFRKSIPVQENTIDIIGAQRDTFSQDLRAFIYHTEMNDEFELERWRGGASALLHLCDVDGFNEPATSAILSAAS